MRSPAVELARRRSDEDGVTTLSTGVRVRLRPIPPGTMQEARASVPIPKVPTWTNPDKNREEPNPNDPDYLDALTECNRQRIQAMEEVALMFGFELIDGVPTEGDWERNLQWLARRKRVDLGGYDLADSVDREFLFKRHYAVGPNDWQLLQKLMGVSREEVDEAAENFRGDGEG